HALPGHLPDEPRAADRRAQRHRGGTEREGAPTAAGGRLLLLPGQPLAAQESSPGAPGLRSLLPADGTANRIHLHRPPGWLGRGAPGALPLAAERPQPPRRLRTHGPAAATRACAGRAAGGAAAAANLRGGTGGGSAHPARGPGTLPAAGTDAEPPTDSGAAPP